MTKQRIFTPPPIGNRVTDTLHKTAEKVVGVMGVAPRMPGGSKKSKFILVTGVNGSGSAASIRLDYYEDFDLVGQKTIVFTDALVSNPVYYRFLKVQYNQRWELYANASRVYSVSANNLTNYGIKGNGALLAYWSYNMYISNFVALIHLVEK